MFYQLRIALLSLIPILFAACNGGTQSKSEACKYGSPVAVFSKDLKKVTKHSFKLNGQKGIETVDFENGTRLELVQTGCNEIRQSFTFFLDKGLDGDEAFWIKQAEEQFRNLSRLSDEHGSYAFWANLFKQGAHLIQLGESFEPEPNTFINLDRIPSNDHNLLVIMVERKG